jgi:hypothetical protein
VAFLDSSFNSEVQMKRLSVMTLVFAVAFTVFLVAPPLLNKQFGFYPLVKVGDVVDIFTPLILIPLYWTLFRLGTDRNPGLAGILVFLLLAAFWVEGQGMHLAANSISHLLAGMEGSDAWGLAYFYDEVLSHYMWHFGIFGLSAIVVFRQMRHPFAEKQTVSWVVILAGIIHGFTLFVIVIEGGTAWLGVPCIVLAALLGSIWGWQRFRQQPLLLFFYVTCLTATLFLAIWGIYWGGLPEFSEVGIIN